MVLVYVSQWELIFIGLTKIFGTLSMNLGFFYNLLNMIHKWIRRFSNFFFKNPVNPSVPGVFPGFITLIIIFIVSQHNVFQRAFLHLFCPNSFHFLERPLSFVLMYTYFHKNPKISPLFFGIVHKFPVWIFHLTDMISRFF